MARFNSLRSMLGRLNLEGPGVAFAALPSPAVLGMVRVVNDATETTVGAVANGGGSAKVMVWFNGTAWRIIGGTDT